MADHFPAAFTGPALFLRSRVRPSWFAGAAVVGAAAFLLARLVPDIHGKPLFEDEAVAGLISARPIPEIIATTVWDRGGSPLHFLLAHFAFVFDSSAVALRWVSVLFALAALPLCYDLGRRLGGQVAGITAAVVAAGSGMLAVYGSFGRMYALFAFAAALAADLFVRALDRRTPGAAAAAAAAAWLLPAVHPYGGIVVGVEALVALAVWRGRRPWRDALPVVAIGLLLVPFAVADLRLANRFEVGSQATQQLADWSEAWHQFTQAIRGFAGGGGWTLLIFLGLAAAGIVLVARRRPAFVAWGLMGLVLPPLLAMVVHTGRAPSLSPRHLIFALPFWSAFIGVAVSWLPYRALAVVAVAVLAAISPQGIQDPRSITYVARLGTEEALAAPDAWLRGHVRERDVLFPYSSVFLGALPETGRATALPRAQPGPVLDALDRAQFPARNLYIAVPLGPAREDLSGFGGDLVPHPFGAWLIVEARGPFPDQASLLQAAWRGLTIAHAGFRGPVPAPLGRYMDLNEYVICAALSTLGSECGR